MVNELYQRADRLREYECNLSMKNYNQVIFIL